LGATRARLIERIIHAEPLPPRRHDPRIPRDLETIVQKSIAKEPGERYATAKALSEDLRNYLSGKPIRARRVGIAERTWRWCRRNPAAAGLVGVSGIAAIALVSVIVGLAFYGQLEAKNAEVKAANGQLKVAKNKLEQSLLNEVTARKNEASIRYSNNVLMAERELTNYNVGRAEQLLDACAPTPGHNDLRGWEWNYLKRQCHTELMTLEGGPSQAWALAFSRDGRYIDSVGYSDNTVKVWDTETWRVKSLQGPKGDDCTYGVAFNFDGTLLAACSGNYVEAGDVKVWEMPTGKVSLEIKAVCGLTCSLAFSPDGNRLAIVGGSWNRSGKVGIRDLSIWDVKSRMRLIAPENASGEMGLIGVAFSPDGKSIATASGTRDPTSTETEPGRVTIRDAQTGDVLTEFLCDGGPLTSIAYDPHGDRIATASLDKSVRIWDSKTGKEIRAFRGHTQVPFGVVFSPDGDRLVSCGEDNSTRIWDATSGQELFTLRGHKLEVHSLAISGNGRWIATSSQDGTVKIWDAGEGRESLTLAVSKKRQVNGVAFSPDDRWVATASDDRTLRIFDAKSARLVRSFDNFSDAMWALQYSPDGTKIAAGIGHWTTPEVQGEISIRNAETGAVMHRLYGHAGLVFKQA
jgi:WD40 repeat protein